MKIRDKFGLVGWLTSWLVGGLLRSEPAEGDVGNEQSGAVVTKHWLFQGTESELWLHVFCDVSLQAVH